MLTLTECTRKSLCCDCDNEKCWHHGKKEADCPKYRCDRDLDCENCAFIDKYIADMRRTYNG